MSSNAALDFLKKHGMSPDTVVPDICALDMLRDMESGLDGKIVSMPMIPTYLSNDGDMPRGIPAAVIDAGGTNYRSALVTFDDGECKVEYMNKCRMPGTDAPVTWDEFISFVADSIEPLMDKTDCIGFCFSYSAEITPEIDGRVICIDKEVVVSGSEGKLIGRSVIEELERRGISGKRVVILNDTAAVLLGGCALLDKSRYSGFIGQVSGTGTNTCCSLPASRIKKLGRDSSRGMLINLESGLYSGMPAGDFDRLLDSQSHNPGFKALEKMTSGVYLGELARLALNAASEEGLLSAAAGEKLKALDRIETAMIDAWACGEKLDELSPDEGDRDFIVTLCNALFERSARCMCSNIIAIMLLTGEGTERERPVCVCAEGSLVQKGRHYRPMLESLLEEYAAGKLGRYAVLKVGQETTLPGSAAAALLNW